MEFSRQAKTPGGVPKAHVSRWSYTILHFFLLRPLVSARLLVVWYRFTEKGVEIFMLGRLSAILMGASGSEAPQLDASNRVALATCVVLMEAAQIDDEFTGSEHAHILETAQRRFSLPQAEAEALLSEASAAHAESHDLWQFTHEINRVFSTSEKISVLEEVWRILYSDGSLEGREDHLAHKLQSLLNLNHKQLIGAKLKVLEERRNGKELGHG